MAVAIAFKALDTSGKKFDTATPTYTTTNSEFIVAEYKKGYINYTGEFEYAGKDLIGTKMNRIDIFNEDNDQTFEWRRYDNESFDPGKILNKAQESGEAYYKYLFKYNDSIVGSPKNDKISGFKGDDFIWGEKGKDKLWGDKGKDSLFGGPGTDKEWGGKGKDTFYFNDGYDKDVLKDFDRKKDKLVIDTELARNVSDVEKKAKQKDEDVHIKLKGNTLVIENYDVDKLDKIKMFFLDEGDLL